MPLYEAKMLHLYDTRWATYEPDGSTRAMTDDEKARHEAPLPRYWVAESEVDRKLSELPERRWYIGWRDICRATDIRTLIAAKLGRVAVGNKIPLMLPSVDNDAGSALQAALSSFVCDFVARQKTGSTTMNYFILKQLAVPRPGSFSQVRGLIAARVDRLNGWITDPEDRAQVRAELDALMFHIYGLNREDASYVLDMFPIVKRKDEAAFGSYRTKELILAVYDALADAAASGIPYRAPWIQEVSS